MDNNHKCSCSKILVTEYFMDGENIFVKTYEEGKNDIVHVDLDILDDQLKSYVCYKLGITEEQFNKTSEGIIDRPVKLIVLDHLESFFVKLYKLNDFSEVMTNQDVNFTWRRIANGVGSIVFEMKPGLKIDSVRLRELPFFE